MPNPVEIPEGGYPDGYPGLSEFLDKYHITFHDASHYKQAVTQYYRTTIQDLWNKTWKFDEQKLEEHLSECFEKQQSHFLHLMRKGDETANSGTKKAKKFPNTAQEWRTAFGKETTWIYDVTSHKMVVANIGGRWLYVFPAVDNASNTLPKEEGDEIQAGIEENDRILRPDEGLKRQVTSIKRVGVAIKIFEKTRGSNFTANKRSEIWQEIYGAYAHHSPNCWADCEYATREPDGSSAASGIVTDIFGILKTMNKEPAFNREDTYDVAQAKWSAYLTQSQ